MLQYHQLLLLQRRINSIFHCECASPVLSPVPFFLPLWASSARQTVPSALGSDTFSHIGNWFSLGFSVQPKVYRHAEGQELHQKLSVGWAKQESVGGWVGCRGAEPREMFKARAEAEELITWVWPEAGTHLVPDRVFWQLWELGTGRAGRALQEYRAEHWDLSCCQQLCPNPGPVQTSSPHSASSPSSSVCAGCEGTGVRMQLVGGSGARAGAGWVVWTGNSGHCGRKKFATGKSQGNFVLGFIFSVWEDREGWSWTYGYDITSIRNNVESKAEPRRKPWLRQVKKRSQCYGTAAFCSDCVFPSKASCGLSSVWSCCERTNLCCHRAPRAQRRERQS